MNCAGECMAEGCNIFIGGGLGETLNPKPNNPSRRTAVTALTRVEWTAAAAVGRSVGEEGRAACPHPPLAWAKAISGSSCTADATGTGP